MGRSIGLLFLILCVSAQVSAETWKADLEVIKEKSSAGCQMTQRGYTLDLTGNVFTASNENGKQFTVTLPPDGSVKQQFKSSSGFNLEMVGNAKTKALEVINTRYACTFRLVPK